MPPVKTPPIKEKERRKLAKIRRGQNRRISNGKVTVTPKARRSRDPFPSRPGSRLSPANPPSRSSREASRRAAARRQRERAESRRQMSRPGTGAEAEMRKTPPAVKRALDNAVKGPGGSLIVRSKRDLHAINQYIRDQGRAQADVRRRMRIERRELAKWRDRQRKLRDPIFTGPPATGDVILPHQTARVIDPERLFSGRKLDFKDPVTAGRLKTVTGIRTSYKDYGKLKRRAMTPAEREAYDKRNRAATIQAGLVGASLIPGVGPVFKAGQLLGLGGKLGAGAARFAARAAVGRSGTAAALRAGQRRVVLAGGKKAVLKRAARGTGLATARAPIALARHPIRTAVASPLIAEVPLAKVQDRPASLQSAISGTGALAALTTQVKGGGHGVTGTLANFGADLVNLPAQVIPSVYLPIAAAIAAAKGDDDRWDQLVEEFKKHDPAGALILGGDPAAAVKALQEHPLYGILEGLGVYGSVGRSAGGAARHGIAGQRGKKFASLEAGPLFNKGEMSLPGARYSPNLITQKLVQEPLRARAQRRVAAGKKPYILPERVRHPFAGSKVMAAGFNTHDQVVSAYGGALRSHINEVFEAAVKVWGKGDLDQSMEAVARIAEGTVRDDFILEDAMALEQEWIDVRPNAKDAAELELVDRNIEAMRMLQDPEFAARALEAARAFREMQTEADLQLMEQDATRAMQLLRRREIPYGVMHNNIEWVPDEAMPGGGSFMQRVADDEGGGAAVPPDGGGGGPRPVTPPDLGPNVTPRITRRGQRPARDMPTIRDRVQNAFGGLIPDQDKALDLIQNINRRVEKGGGQGVHASEGFGEILGAPGRLRPATLDDLMADPQFAEFINELNDVHPEAADDVVRAYRMDTEDPLADYREFTPEELDKQYMELAKKSDEQIRKELEDLLKPDDDETTDGGGTGVKDRDSDDIREIHRVVNEAQELQNEVQNVVFDETREPPFDPTDELTMAYDDVQGARMAYEAGEADLMDIETAVERLREIWDDERPMTQDEIAGYFAEVEQLPEAARREPGPAPKQAQERGDITHEEFMEHFESRKGLGSVDYREGAGNKRLPGDTPEASAKNVNMEFLHAFINGMMDPFKTEQWGQLAQRLAKEFTDRGEHISWATIRIAESLGNYHPWMKPLSPDKWNEYHRLETGEPRLGEPDKMRLQRVMDELAYEQSLPKENQNPSYIARLVRQVAEATSDPTYRQIEGLPEVNRAPMIERLNEAIESARESLEFYKEDAQRGPEHPINKPWRALNNALLRAERMSKDGDFDPSAILELERRVLDIEDEYASLSEIGGGDFGQPDFPVTGAKRLADMDLDELHTERGDLIDEMRAQEIAGDERAANEARENIKDVDAEIKKREQPSDEAVNAVRRASLHNTDVGLEYLRQLDEEELLSMWDEAERALDEAGGMTPDQIRKLDRVQQQIIQVLQERGQGTNVGRPMGQREAEQRMGSKFNEPKYTGDERARVEKEAGDALKNEFGDVTPPPTPRGNTADQAYRVEDGQYVSNDPNAPVKYYRVTHDNGDVRLQWARSETEALHRSTWGVNGSSKAIKAEKAGPEQTQGIGPPYTPGDPLPPTQVPSDVRSANLRSEDVMHRTLDALAEALDERGHTDLYDRLTTEMAAYMQGRKGADETRLEASRIESESIKRLQSEGSQPPPPGAGGPPSGDKGGSSSGGGGGGRIPPMKPTPSGGQGGNTRLVPISTAEMARQRIAQGQPGPAYVQHGITGAGRAVERALERPATFKSKALHAESLVSGQAPGTMGTLARSVTKALGYANKIGLHREITRLFGAKKLGEVEPTIFKDGDAGMKALESGEYPLSGKPQDYVPIPAPPPKLVKKELDTLKEHIDSTNPDAYDLDIFDSIEDFNKSLHDVKRAEHGVIMVRKEIADRYAELTARPRSLERGMAVYQSVFKSAVLPTSTKWIAGNLFDVSIRALIGGLLPPGLVYLSDNYRVGKALYNTMVKIDPEAARRFLSGPLQGTHFSSQEAAIHHIKDVNEWAQKDLHPLLDMLVNDKGSPIRWYKGYRDMVFKFNSKFIEQTPLFAMLGKVAKADIRARIGSWHKVMKSGDAAIEDVARGLLKTENQVRYATEFSKLFGDWGRLRPNEKQFLVNYAPFYLWARASARFVLITLPRDHPVFTGLVAAAQGMTDQERKRLGFDILRASAVAETGTGFARKKEGRASPVPNFLQGGIVTPSGQYKGLAYSTSFGVFNDYPNTLANFILPQASGALQAAGGLDFTGDTITRADGSKANPAEKAALVAYFLFEPLVPFAAMGRSIYRAGRTQAGVAPLHYKGKKEKFLKNLGHTLIPSPIPGSKSYDPGLVRFLREKEGNLYQIWVPLKQPAKGFGGGREGKGFGGSGRGSKGFKRAGE